jgi:hypothetical protein
VRLTRLFEGFGQAPGMFQGQMVKVFDVKVHDTVEIYLDDVCVHTCGTREEHFKELREVLDICREVNVHLS